jgi:hypothetical protein
MACELRIIGGVAQAGRGEDGKPKSFGTSVHRGRLKRLAAPAGSRGLRIDCANIVPGSDQRVERGDGKSG